MAHFYKTISRVKHCRGFCSLKYVSIPKVRTKLWTMSYNRDTICGKLASFHLAAVSRSKSEEDSISETVPYIDEYIDRIQTDQVYLESIEENVRDSLYPDSCDEFILKLKKCQTIQQVMDTLEILEKQATLNVSHLCQALLTLSDLQTNYLEMYIGNLGRDDIDVSPEKMIDNYTNQQMGNKQFIQFVLELSKRFYLLSSSESVTCLFHLKKLGFSSNSSVFLSLIRMVIDKMTEHPSEWNLDMLIKYTSSIKLGKTFLHADPAKHAMPLIIKYLEKSEVKDFRCITICLNNIHFIVTMSLLEEYKKKCTKYLESGSFTPEYYKTTIEVLRFLNISHWARRNIPETIKLCLLAEQSIEKLNMSEIILLHKIYRANMEPATIIYNMQGRIRHFLKELKYDEKITTYLKLPDLLFCELNYSPVKNRSQFKGIILDLLKRSLPLTLIPLYKSMRFLKIHEYSFCDILWQKMIDDIAMDCKEEYHLVQMAMKYMYFNNNLGGTYRNTYFEDSMIGLLFQAKTNGLLDVVPFKYIRFLSFFIGYGLTSPTNKWNHVNFFEMVKKLQEMSYDLTVTDIFSLSRGIDIYNKLSSNKNTEDPNVRKSIATLNAIIDNSSFNVLSKDSLNLSLVNAICKSFIYRYSSYDTELFEIILSKYCSIRLTDITSKLIKESFFNFISTHTFVENYASYIIDYVLSKKMLISGDVMQNMTHSLFLAAYTPNVEFLNVANQVLERDKEIISSLALLQSCQSLCFFGQISRNLINYIFSMEFMERLDSEIENCYSKFTYPKRLRNQLMALNRTVCIEYPELEIPWFHQKFVEEIFAFEPIIRTKFSVDVYENLLNILNNKDLIKVQHCSPYGYIVDYFFRVDNKNFKITNTEYDSTKVAVILLRSNSFIKIFNKVGENELTKELVINGNYQLRRKHLELMGYRVIEVSPLLWNSMHMAEPNAKHNFLKNKICGL